MIVGARSLVCGSLLLLAPLGASQAGKAEAQQGNGKVVQSMSIQAPTMSEEDQYGYTMPGRYRCDACRAVVFHLKEALTQKQPKNRRLKEWELEELFEQTCKSGFKGYGIKLLGGENVLSGPGLKHDESLEPGFGTIQMGGETWEKRLGEICRSIVYDKVGEDRLYKFFETEKLTEDICLTESRDCRTGPKEAPQKSDKKSKTSERKARQARSEKKLDLKAFMASLAAENAQDVAEYTKTHSKEEWQRLLLQAAGWISASKGELPFGPVEV